MDFDAHIPLLVDKQLIGEKSQTPVEGKPWFVHYQAGFASGDCNQAILSCLVANNEDHGHPNLVPESREFVVRFQWPFSPVRIRLWPPGNRESFVCLVTFENMNDHTFRSDIHELVNVPFAETEERCPSWNWQWRELPF